MDFISKKNVIEHVNLIRLSVFSLLTGKFSVNYVLPFKEECRRTCSFDKTINFHIAFLNSTPTSLALLYWMLLATGKSPVGQQDLKSICRAWRKQLKTKSTSFSFTSLHWAVQASGLPIEYFWPDTTGSFSIIPFFSLYQKKIKTNLVPRSGSAKLVC